TNASNRWYIDRTAHSRRSSTQLRGVSLASRFTEVSYSAECAADRTTDANAESERAPFRRARRPTEQDEDVRKFERCPLRDRPPNHEHIPSLPGARPSNEERAPGKRAARAVFFELGLCYRRSRPA